VTKIDGNASAAGTTTNNGGAVVTGLGFDQLAFPEQQHAGGCAEA